ncbi:MAG: 6,7-dimethyl-8-ribityllumazine synthase [candidate division Zixibacteria bacterium 4484_95]|nr:MAG: 6,7-dimethyl-8-ribityllumazine synthase [candidate division Zixibacteria bacterium 4484_95]
MEIAGNLNASGFKFALVVSRFNEFFTTKLLEGTLDCLKRHGASEKDIDIIRVPGSFEIPYAASKLARGKKYDAVICLGVIIRGQTPHYEYVSSEVAKGIARISLENELPVIFGIVTADTLEQAIERSGSKSGNRGFAAALTAIEMVNLFREI